MKFGLHVILPLLHQYETLLELVNVVIQLGQSSEGVHLFFCEELRWLWRLDFLFTLLVDKELPCRTPFTVIQVYGYIHGQHEGVDLLVLREQGLLEVLEEVEGGPSNHRLDELIGSHVCFFLC